MAQEFGRLADGDAIFCPRCRNFPLPRPIIPPFSARQWPALPIAVALVAGIAAHRLLPAGAGNLAAVQRVALGVPRRFFFTGPSVLRSARLCALMLLGGCFPSAACLPSIFPAITSRCSATDEPQLAIIEVRSRRASAPAPFGARQKRAHRECSFQATALPCSDQAPRLGEGVGHTVRVSIGQEVAGLLIRPDRSARGDAAATRWPPATPASLTGQATDARNGCWPNFPSRTRVARRCCQGRPARLWHHCGSVPARALDAGFPLAASAAELFANSSPPWSLATRGKELSDTCRRRSPGRAPPISWPATDCVSRRPCRPDSISSVSCFAARRAPPSGSSPSPSCSSHFSRFPRATGGAARGSYALPLSASLCWQRDCSVNSVQLLSLAALPMLVLNPLDACNAGFQLSFVTVLGLMLFAGPVGRWLGELESPHHRAARDLLRRSAFHNLGILLWDRGRQLLAASLVAWLIATPLVASQFEQFNPWSIPIGIVLSPHWCSWRVIAGFAKVCLTLAIPWFASWTGRASLSSLHLC